MNESFSDEWYGTDTDQQMWYQGWQIIKCPLDLWQYQEIIWQIKPTLVIETGSFTGASALWFAHQLDLNGGGRVISIDIAVPEEVPEHPQVEFMFGRSSIDWRVVEKVKQAIANEKVMVVLDSDHGKQHVLLELKTYAPLVSPGSYLIVEDTNRDAYKGTGFYGYCDEMKLAPPAQAIKEWNPKKHGFEVDLRWERLLFTQNPGGFLKKVKNGAL